MARARTAGGIGWEGALMGISGPGHGPDGAPLERFSGKCCSCTIFAFGTECFCRDAGLFFAEARLKQIVLPRNRHVADFAANLVLGDRCVVVVRKRAAVGRGCFA